MTNTTRFAVGTALGLLLTGTLAVLGFVGAQNQAISRYAAVLERHIDASQNTEARVATLELGFSSLASSIQALQDQLAISQFRIEAMLSEEIVTERSLAESNLQEVLRVYDEQFRALREAVDQQNREILALKGGRPTRSK